MALDPVRNNLRQALASGYSISATSITVPDGSKFPDNSEGDFNIIWWNITDYADSTDDPDMEIVRVTSRTGNVLTITRAQEGTTASAKNIGGKTYAVALVPTKKTIDDINDALESHETTLQSLETDINDLGDRTTQNEADIANLETEVAGKQDALGYTPENVANKENTTLDTSTTKYPTNRLVKEGLDAKQNTIGYTPENVANKDTDATMAANSDTKYPSQKAVKTALATKQDTLAYTPEDVANKDTDGTLTANSDTKYPSQKAVKTYADTKIPLSQKGANSGVATLDSGGKIPASQLPSTVMEFKGTWDASTNTPTLADGTGDNGDVYLVSVAGTQDLGSGAITFAVGDWVVYNGSVWQKSINSNTVVSVNGQQGVVVLTTTHITEGTNLYYTSARFDSAFAGKTTADLSENTNLYFTNARAIGSTLTGYTSGAGTISPSDTILSAIQKLNGNVSAIPSYTFSTGLTNNTNTITVNLSTGISGGQSVIGGTASGENLTLSSTSNATKGKIIFGTSAYDEVNSRLGIGTTSPLSGVHIAGTNGDANIAFLSTRAVVSSTNIRGSGIFHYYSGLANQGDMLAFGVAGDWNGVAQTYTNPGLIAQAKMVIGANGNVGIGLTAPTAALHLKAGTATASTAPLKFTAGTNLTTPEAGVVEYTTNNFWFSPSTTNRIRFGYGGSGSSGATNLVIGQDAGTNLTTGSASNIYIGRLSGVSQTAGIGNTGVGSGALGTHTGYTGNTAIGEAALYYGSGSQNTAVGDYAMFSDSGANSSIGAIAIGANSFFKKSAGNYGIAIGFNAGYTVSTAVNSIIIGYNAVNGGVMTGTDTIAIGTEAGKILTSGAYNILMGYRAGDAITTGSNNIIIGKDIDAQSASGDNQLSIGNLIFGTGLDGTGTTVSSGKIGIGIVPTQRFTLPAGTASAGTAPLGFTAGTNLTTAVAGVMEYDNTPHFTNSDATRRHFVLAPNTTKVTAGAPYTNDGYVVMSIGGTDFNVMTTA